MTDDSVFCPDCSWHEVSGHKPDCPKLGYSNSAWDREHARVAAEAHEQLRTQFALALVRGLGSVPAPAAWSHGIFDTADALAAENAKRRKAEGL